MPDPRAGAARRHSRGLSHHPMRVNGKDVTVMTTTEQGVQQGAQHAVAPPGAAASPMADPGAWAVTAFGTTSFMLGIYNTGLLGAGSEGIVIPAAFFFGGLVQIIVAILEIQRGNLFGAAVFGTYGPFWVIYAAIQTLFAGNVPQADLSSALSLFLAMFAVITVYLFIASLRTDKVLTAILALIFIGLVLLSIAEGTGSEVFKVAGGWVTLAFAVLAWYHAASDIIAATFERRVLPVGPVRPRA